MLSKTDSYFFEGYRLDTKPPGLWRDGQLVAVPPKVLKMLILLVEKNDQIVTREELLDAVWPETHVEEGNIKYTISLLRKALGKDLVQTIPRQGYRFVARVEEIGLNGKPLKPPSTQSRRTLSPDSHVETPLINKGGVTALKASGRRLLIGTLVAAVLVMTITGLWWKFHAKPKIAVNRNIKSIAILPLKTLNDDETSKAISFGLTESLISRLGSLNRFTVRPLEAVEPYAKSGRDALKSGGELKVDAVLEGTLQTIENRLRVTVRLIDIRDGAQIWTVNIDETERDVFKLQDRLAANVANSLLVQMTREEQSLLVNKQTENPEAYRAYARGRAILDRKNSDRFDSAMDEFQKALNLDPAFAVAYAGMADAFLMKGNVLSGAAADESFIRAARYAEKARDLGEDSAELRTVQGRLKRNNWDWPGAEQDFKRAIQLNPNHAEAHRYFAQMLSFLGRQDEAITEINQALEINPISPAITMAQFSILESRGEYDRALKLANEFYRFDKENSLAKRAVATFLFHRGEYSRVIEIGEQLTAKDERQKFAFLSLLTTSYLKTGQTLRADETLRELEQLAQGDTKALYSLAMNYAEMGRAADATWALRKCFDWHEDRIVWLNVEPRFASLRNDSRFQDLVTKMRLQKG